MKRVRAGRQHVRSDEMLAELSTERALGIKWHDSDSNNYL